MAEIILTIKYETTTKALQMLASGPEGMPNPLHDKVLIYGILDLAHESEMNLPTRVPLVPVSAFEAAAILERNVGQPA